MEYKVDLPYPSLKVEKTNLAYAYLLLNDYAGITSELTSILQYSYQHFIKFEINNVISETLANIAKIEMHHLAILGKLIYLLGMDPNYAYNNINWQSTFVNYNTNNKDMLIQDIVLEKDAIKNYEKDLTIIKDKYIQDILKRIILDEEKHLECFTILLKNYS